jgi:hypothetical protein
LLEQRLERGADVLLVRVVGIRTVDQAWRETLHAVSLKAVLQRKKRHYSLLGKGKVANYQRIIVGNKLDRPTTSSVSWYRTSRHHASAEAGRYHGFQMV